MNVSYPRRLFLSSLAASAATTVASANAGTRGGGSSSCPPPAAPYAQDARAEDGSFLRCPSGSDADGGDDDDVVLLRDLVVCASGTEGFGENGEDFDLFRSLAEEVGLWDDGDGLLDDVLFRNNNDGAGDDSTIFLPNDGGFYSTAKSLGYDPSNDELGGGGYDEEAILNFYLESFPRDKLRNVLLYHIAAERHDYERLKEGMDVETILDGEHVLASAEKAKPGASCRERVRLVDGHGKTGLVHKKYRDIETRNGVVHVVNVLLLPASFFSDGSLIPDPEEFALVDVR